MEKMSLTFGSAAIPGGQVSAAAIETINDNLSSSPYTWTVNLAAGEILFLLPYSFFSLLTADRHQHHSQDH